MVTFTGGCLCGSVTYTCEAEPGLIMNCHCADCQKAMGAVFATTMFVPEDRVTIRGYPRTYSHAADSGSSMSKIFCEQCGSQLFSKNTNRPGTLGIRAGSSDDKSVILPTANIYTASAVPTTSMDEQLPKHGGMPG